MILYWLISYLAGNLMTAWWIGKWKKVNLQQENSGNLGARNAGAVLGKPAFFLTFFGDALKGAIIIAVGDGMHFSDWIIAIGGFLVIFGHLFPFWLKGKGGKGISTFIGAGLIYDPLLFSLFVIGVAATIPFLKSATLSMVAGYIVYSGGIIGFGHYPALPFIAAIICILLLHKENLKESLETLRST
ncbi:glycerol-3-phosphate acyltransferase [Chungangia koreensis]|uniref:Glycerol-3-phosphate acyltransferase n=1 Tax=Chungangia koreensis TaxID=752657 RepID=A0ABV8X9D8_9LACT